MSNLKIMKNIIPEEAAFETVIKDALRYIDEDDSIDGIEYQIGSAGGREFKLVIEPEGASSFDSGVVTQDYMAYTLIYEDTDND